MGPGRYLIFFLLKFPVECRRNHVWRLIFDSSYDHFYKCDHFGNKGHVPTLMQIHCDGGRDQHQHQEQQTQDAGQLAGAGHHRTDTEIKLPEL